MTKFQQCEKKKTCLSLKEVLKQRLFSHWREKLAASTHDLSNTADLQLKLQWHKDTGQALFSFFLRELCEEGKGILPSKVL